MSRLGELPLPSKIVIPGRSIAYSDAGAALTEEDYLSGIKKPPGNIFEHDSLQYPTKEYSIELKPLFSAFGWKSLAQTSLRSFLMCYLLLLEPRSNVEEDDDDFLQDAPEEHHVDLVAPFKKSVVQIIREVLDALVNLFCRSNISAETLWDGGWLLRQLLPYSEAEFNSHHLKLLKESYKNCTSGLHAEARGTWSDVLITVLCDEWKNCKREIEASSPRKEPKCLLFPSQA